MTAWAAWLGLGLGLANVAVWAAVFVGVRGLVAQYRARLEPYLSLFSAPDDAPIGGEVGEVVVRLDQADMN